MAKRRILSQRQEHRLDHMVTEERQPHLWEQCFQELKDIGAEKHGMLFVKAQECALARMQSENLFRFIHTPMGAVDPVYRAMIVTIVLAALDAAKEKNPKRNPRDP